MSQTRRVPSLLPEIACSLSGLIITLETPYACPLRMRRHRPVSRSQTRRSLSSPPETTRRPSGLMLTLMTQPLCPSRVRRHWPVSRFQTRRVWSSLPEIARPPSGLTLTPLTLPLCPSSVRRHWPVSMSQIRRVLSQLAETTRRPSEVTSMLLTLALWPSNVRRHSGRTGGAVRRAKWRSQGGVLSAKCRPASLATGPSSAWLNAIDTVSCGRAAKRAKWLETKTLKWLRLTARVELPLSDMKDPDVTANSRGNCGYEGLGKCLVRALSRDHKKKASA